MNLSEYHLSVKEFATICHTTRDTLRHYYENGIIEPFVDPENGYHYYSPSQISAFFYVLSLKNVGCSLKEIKSMMQSTDPSLYQSILKAKANELRQRIADLNVGLTTISTYDWMLDLVEQGRTTGQVACYEIPRVYITETPIASKNAYHMKDVTKELTVHLKNLNQKSNIFPIGATIALDHFLERDYAFFSLQLKPKADKEENNYDGYVLDGMHKAIEKHFRSSIGKVFRPYNDEKFMYVGLENNDKFYDCKWCSEFTTKTCYSYCKYY